MESPLFESLVASIKESGKIRRGEVKASRTFSFSDSLVDRSPGYVEETLESAGCTGGCESFKDGLPNCEACSQFKK